MSRHHRHHRDHPAAAVPPEGIANSPYKFYFELLFISLLADLALALWLWKLKSFPSHPWYQSLPEFGGAVGKLAGYFGALPGALAVFLIFRGVWTGKKTEEEKKKDIAPKIVKGLKRFIAHRLTFWLFVCGSGLACSFMFVKIFQMPGSQQAMVYLNPFSADPRQPIGLALSPSGQELYVADEAASRLVVLGTSPLKIRHSVSLPDPPHRLAVSPDGRTIFATSPAAGVVDVLDTHGFKVIARISTGPKPYWITVRPDGAKVYVSNQGDFLPDGSISGTVSVIDATNLTVVNTISNLNFPEGMDIARDTGLMYLASQGGHTYDISQVNLTDEQFAKQFDEFKQYTEAKGNWGGDPVFVIDTASDRVLWEQTISNMEVGTTLAVKPDGTKVYVARGNFVWHGPFKRWDIDHHSRTPLGVLDITRIGSPTVLTNIVLKTCVSAVVLTADGRYALASSDSEIAIVDTETDRLINRVRLPASPSDIIVGPDNWVFVTLPEKGILFAFSLKGLV